MALTLDEAVKKLEAAPLGALVVPVRITAHGEDGSVLYGYGGLGYQPSNPPHLVVEQGSPLFQTVGHYAFLSGRSRLVTENAFTNQRVRMLNNQIYDPSRPDGLSPTTFQSFIIDRYERTAIEIGWASKDRQLANPHLIMRVTRGDFPNFIGADIEIAEQGSLLTGLGALTATLSAIWTVSLLDPVPRVGNELS